MKKGETPKSAAASRAREEKTFHKALESISAELALEPLLTRVLGHACELLNVPAGSIGLYEPERNSIRITATHGFARKRIGMLMGPGQGVAGRVITSRKPVIETNYARVPGAWAELKKHNIMGVPILRKRRLLGFFCVAALPPRRFDKNDVDLLSLVARHAAVAIENAETFEKQRRRMERLSLITRVSHIIAAGLELDDLLSRTVLAIRRVLGYSNVALALIDPEAPDTLVIRAIGGTGAKELSGFRLNISKGISGAAIRERKIQFVPDVRQDPRYVPCRGTEQGVVSTLAVPILMGGAALGVVNVEGRPPFGEEDAETLKLVADHLASAIHNAALFEREKVRSRRLALISRIGQIAATGLNRQDLLQRAADAVHELLGYANIDIPVIEPDQPDILLFGARGGEHKKIAFADRMPIHKGIIGAAVTEKRTQLVNDVASDPRYVTPPLNLRNRAELAVPIIQGGRVLGVLNVEGAKPFDADDAASLEIVADHLAVALRNAELHAEERQEAVHEERQRLSRDLHDSVTQLLFSMSLLAQSLGPSWKRSAEEGERKAGRIVQLSGAALREMRALIGALYPADVLDEDSTSSVRGSLPSRLRDLAPETQDGGPKVSVLANGWLPQDPKIEGVLFRVGQEAMTNAFKHAGARSIDVLLTADERRVSLTVVDDGQGFEKTQRRKRRSSAAGGMGLGIMQARVREQGGRFTLRSSPARGTTVRAVFDSHSLKS